MGGRSLESGGTASGVSGPGAPGRTSLTQSLPRQADPDSLSLQRSWASTPHPARRFPVGFPGSIALLTVGRVPGAREVPWGHLTL